MKLSEMMKNTEHEILKDGEREISGMTIDSRKVSTGDIFICIEGLQLDGHKYIEQAANAGAAAVLVSKNAEIPKKLAAVKVPDSRSAMSVMAGNFYNWPSKNYPLIGITGTNGKTSSAYFMETVLKEFGHKTGIIGTVSTRAGDIPVKTKFATSSTPDPIELHQIFGEMLEAKVDEVVMEVTSHALEFHKVEGLNFKVSIFTNLTQDHLDIHGTMENYRDTKAKLFAISDISVINIDDEYGEYMLNSATGKTITYSIEKPSNLQAKNINYSNTGVAFDLELEETVRFEIPIPGRFTVYNALGVIGAALNVGIPLETIRDAFKHMKGVPGRIQSIPNSKGIGVFVDYSHTPDSLENIINAVREFTENKVYTVFGCGGDRDKMKRPIMGDIAAKLSDFSVITSDNPRSEDPLAIVDDIEPAVKAYGDNYAKIVDRKEAIFYAIKHAKPGDSVIIAGKGHENYQIFANETIHFDDAEIALEALEGLE